MRCLFTNGEVRPKSEERILFHENYATVHREDSASKSETLGDSHRSKEVPKTIFRLRWPGQRHNLGLKEFIGRGGSFISQEFFKCLPRGATLGQNGSGKVAPGMVAEFRGAGSAGRECGWGWLWSGCNLSPMPSDAKYPCLQRK